MKSYFNTDVYQTKYYESLKIMQNVNEKYLQSQLEFCNIKNTVGVYMINLVEALPESFTSKFYPEIIAMLVKIKNTNDKLFLLF
jgi:hypothetical protein